MLINNKSLIKTIKRVDLTNEQETNLNEMPEIKKNINDIKTIIGDNENGLIKDVKNLKENAVNQDSINMAVNNYLTEHPVTSGATAEQAAQIEANTNAIGTEELPTTAKTLKGAIAETFQSVSNGKTLIASAITDKGVTTSNTDTFQTMANNIFKF